MQENWHIVDNNHNNKVNDDRLPEGPCLVSDLLYSKGAVQLAGVAAFSNAAFILQQPTSRVTGQAASLLHCPSPQFASTKLLLPWLFSETRQKNRCKLSRGGQLV